MTWYHNLDSQFRSGMRLVAYSPVALIFPMKGNSYYISLKSYDLSMLKTRQKELQINSINSSEDAKPDHYKLPESMY